MGRTASARRIFEDLDEGTKQIRENFKRGCVSKVANASFYHTKVIVGLSEEFSVQSGFADPEGFENNLYSYLLNFQPANSKILKTYQKSVSFDEGDLLYLL